MLITAGLKWLQKIKNQIVMKKEEYIRCLSMLDPVKDAMEMEMLVHLIRREYSEAEVEDIIVESISRKFNS